MNPKNQGNVSPSVLSGWRSNSKTNAAKTGKQSKIDKFVLPTQNRFDISDETDDDPPQVQTLVHQCCCRGWKLKCLKLEQDNKGLKKEHHDQKVELKAKNLKLQKEIDDLKKQLVIATAAQSFVLTNSPRVSHCFRKKFVRKRYFTNTKKLFANACLLTPIR